MTERNGASPKWVAGLLASALLPLLALAVLIGPGLVHRYVLGLGATDVHAIRALPARILVCGRAYRLGADPTVRSHDEILTWSGVEPTLVDPDPLPPCPAGPCRRVDIGPCATVVFVRVGKDAYVDYELEGGP